MQEKEHITHDEGVLLVGETKSEASMLSKASANDDGDRQRQQSSHAHIVIGDILLHAKSKLTVIQVVTAPSPSSSTSTAAAVTTDKRVIHRLTANSSGTNASPALVPCDLKNAPPVKTAPERVKSSSSSSKKIMRMQKAGLAFMKEFKSKVINGNHPEPKTNASESDADSEQTRF